MRRSRWGGTKTMVFPSLVALAITMLPACNAPIFDGIEPDEPCEPAPGCRDLSQLLSQISIDSGLFVRSTYRHDSVTNCDDGCRELSVSYGLLSGWFNDDDLDVAVDIPSAWTFAEEHFVASEPPPGEYTFCLGPSPARPAFESVCFDFTLPSDELVVASISEGGYLTASFALLNGDPIEPRGDPRRPHVDLR